MDMESMKEQISQQIEQQTVQKLLGQLTRQCFQSCISMPRDQFTRNETQCLGNCATKYKQFFEVVGKALGQHNIMDE